MQKAEQAISSQVKEVHMQEPVMLDADMLVCARQSKNHEYPSKKDECDI